MFLLFAFGAIIALCALLWRVAIYALPVFVGLWTGWWAVSAGAGVFAAIIGLIAGVATWELAKHGFASGNRTTRIGLAMLFALPAAYTGFQIIWQISDGSGSSILWRSLIGVVAALAVGITTAARLANLLSEDRQAA
jgi:hypothetical protein